MGRELNPELKVDCAKHATNSTRKCSLDFDDFAQEDERHPFTVHNMAQHLGKRTYYAQRSTNTRDKRQRKKSGWKTILKGGGKGMLLGALLGAGIGSLAGPIGTLILGLIGAGLGGLAGAAIGRYG